MSKQKKAKEDLCNLYSEAITDFKEYFRSKKKALQANKKKTQKKAEPEE